MPKEVKVLDLEQLGPFQKKVLGYHKALPLGYLMVTNFETVMVYLSRAYRAEKLCVPEKNSI
jgi:hypothetical protein